MNIIPIIDLRIKLLRQKLPALQNLFHQVSGAITELEQLKTQLQQKENNEHPNINTGSGEHSAPADRVPIRDPDPGDNLGVHVVHRDVHPRDP